MKRIHLVLVVILGAVGFVAVKLAGVLDMGSGYAAKNICSGVFISGMDGQQIVDEALVGASALLANTRFIIDKKNQRVTTNLFGFFHRHAIFSAGTGCTLYSDEALPNKQALKLVKYKPAEQELLWPTGLGSPVVDPDIARIIDAAFEETDLLKPRNTKAVVVIHKGILIGEKYADGISNDTPLLGWSMAKSVTNLLLGALILDGKLDIYDPAPVSLWQEPGDSKADITIDNLLRMSSGLAFDEEYGLFSDVSRMLSTEANVSEFAAGKPLESSVDSGWHYSSGTTNIISRIIRNAINGDDQSYYDYVQRHLLQPLGMRSATFEIDESGTHIGSSYFYASARDWAKLGWLCLSDGVWNGERIVPKYWMTYSTTPTKTNPLNHYGAHFWLNAKPTDATVERVWPSLPLDAYAMDGYQGQSVVIIPSLDLVVVRLGFTAGDNAGIETLVRDIADLVGT